MGNIYFNDFDVSFRCYYENGNICDHRQKIALCDIARWIDAYYFTHPCVKAITVKVWLTDLVTDSMLGDDIIKLKEGD